MRGCVVVRSDRALVCEMGVLELGDGVFRQD